MSWKFWGAIVTGYAIIAVLLYSPSLGGPWQYDDYAQILDQKVLTSRDFWHLIPSVFRFTAWPDGWTGTRDLVRATFWLNWKWWDLRPLGYRWVNLAIHVANALLVTVLVRLLLSIPEIGNRKPGKEIQKKPRVTFDIQHSEFLLPILAGLLFLIHPIQSQGVAYVAQRFTSMATMFYVGAVVCWLFALRAKREPKSRTPWFFWYGLALLSALLALNSKEIAITLPGVLVLVTIFFGRVTRSKPSPRAQANGEQGTGQKNPPVATFGPVSRPVIFLFLIPFFLFALKIPLQVWSSSAKGWEKEGKLLEITTAAVGLDQRNPPPTRPEYFLTEINVVRTYLRLLIVPIKQTLDYDYPITRRLDLATGMTGLLHLYLLGMGVWLFLKGTKDTSLIGLGILWFYLTVGIESSFIPIPDVIYEHRVYLPFVGVAIAASGIVPWGTEFLRRAGLWQWKGVIKSIVVLWVVFLCGATLRRAWVWGNEIRLWKDVYENAQNKPRANKNYGVVLAASGKYDQGIELLKKANQLDPENADYASNLGTAYLRSQKFQEASAQFIRAYNLSLVEAKSKNEPLPKETAQYISDFGVTMIQTEHGADAKKAFERALELNPDLYAAKIGLGAAQNLLGDLDGAAETFRKLTETNSDQADAFGNFATILVKQGKYSEALTALMTAKKLQPNFPDIDSRITSLTKRITGSGGK